MSSDGSTLQHHKTIFDDWRSLTLGIYMALAGYAVMVGMPVISTSWVNNLGFTDEQVGFVAGIEYEIDYDSEPAVRVDKTDTTFRLKLGYEWN